MREVAILTREMALFHRVTGTAMVVLLLLAGCEWREDAETVEPTPSSPEHRFALTFPDHFFTCPPTPAHIRWKDSLVRNIHHQGNAHVFMLTDLVVLDHGATRTGIVYQNTDNPSQFMVTPEQYWVVIDRKESLVGTMGCGGVTTHPHPDGQMIVCLEPKPCGGIIGVDLFHSRKWDLEPPVFTDDEVCWTWGGE